MSESIGRAELPICDSQAEEVVALAVGPIRRAGKVNNVGHLVILVPMRSFRFGATRHAMFALIRSGSSLVAYSARSQRAAILAPSPIRRHVPCSSRRFADPGRGCGV